MAPKSKYWHIELLDRAAKNQPKKVVPYLHRVVSIDSNLGDWMRVVGCNLQYCDHVCSDAVGAYHVRNKRAQTAVVDAGDEE